jgi:hypothetical protein
MYVRLFASGILAAVVAAVGCGGDERGGRLAGKVTFKGQPVPFATIVATGPAGKTAGGTTNEKGEYLMPEPPEGQLKFKVITSAPKAGQPRLNLPAKYAGPQSGLSYDYTGGNKTYDIDLTP